MKRHEFGLCKCGEEINQKAYETAGGEWVKASDAEKAIAEALQLGRAEGASGSYMQTKVAPVDYARRVIGGMR